MESESTFRLSDEAVFRRTKLGQAELAWPSGQLSGPQRQVLGAISGNTPLRAVLDLADVAIGMRESIEGLVRKRLIVQVA